MVEIHHKPVMVQEVLDGLRVEPENRYIDCTLGEGGHTLAILSAVSPSPKVLGIDLDAEALKTARERLAEYSEWVILVQGSYADIDEIARDNGFVSSNGVLFDLGISSLQIDTGERGFSIQQEAPLDMRFGPSQTRTAYDVVNGLSEYDLASIIYRFGEEPKSRQIARAIVRNRPIQTTTQLADLVSKISRRSSGRSRIHPATKTFQAIRMAVNGELENIERGLERAITVLDVEGRMVVISYHSIEDRLVKNILRREASACICPPETPECVCGHSPTIELVNRRVIKPSPEEVRSNPRSRSARIRIAERV